MPQIFQVLKCYKCSVFQVHQTKKSNKWECKLCGEKQSIKRHFGIGTGKECRLHVQKLNSIRGEVNKINDTDQQNNSSDEEASEKDVIKVTDKKQASIESKWAEFVDKTEDIKEPEPNESMYLENVEVVLEIPSKRQRFPKAKANKNASTSYSSNKTSFGNTIGSPSPPPIRFDETQMSNDRIFLPETSVKKSDTNIAVKTQIDIESKEKPDIKHFVTHETDKTSKWAQFADESDGDNCEDDDYFATCNNVIDISKDVSGKDKVCNDKNTINDDATKSSKIVDLKMSNYGKITENTVKPTNIFSLCDENDLDDVLDF